MDVSSNGALKDSKQKLGELEADVDIFNNCDWKFLHFSVTDKTDRKLTRI